MASPSPIKASPIISEKLSPAFSAPPEIIPEPTEVDVTALREELLILQQEV